MPVTDSEIQLLSNEDSDLNENQINIMRRLAVECNNDSAAMIERVSSIFIKSMQEDEEIQEIVDLLIMTLRDHNDDIRDEFEEKLINIGLYQLQLAFEKVIELIPDHTDAEIYAIFEEILDSDDFEQNLLETAKGSDAYADFMVTVARCQLEQYTSPALIFSGENNSESKDNVYELNPVRLTPR